MGKRQRKTRKRRRIAKREKKGLGLQDSRKKDQIEK